MHTDRELTEEDLALADDGHIETEMRLNNLMWTVSGNYKQNTKLDTASWSQNKYVSMYDAVKQGGFDRFFDSEEFSMYLVKKIYYGGDPLSLQNIGQMAVDAAVYPSLVKERPGTAEIREKAFDYLLENRFDALNQTHLGKIRIALMRGALSGNWDMEDRVRRPMQLLRALSGAQDTMDLIRATDEVYNTIVDPYFVKKHGDLAHVLAATEEDLKEFDWKDFLDEEAEGDQLEEYVEKLQQNLTAFEPAGEKKEREQKERTGGRKVVVLDQEALAKMDRYIQLSYGNTYLRPQEEKQLNYRLCRGAHTDCRLYYTDGILNSHLLKNAQYAGALRQKKNNTALYKKSIHVVNANVEIMADFLKRSMLFRSQVDYVPDYTGRINPVKLWRPGRVENPGKLFYKKIRQRSNEFAVEILMDQSGSQRAHQGQVALQALIISRALSRVHLPHRICGFCSFWDYTVIQRFRDYDDPAENDDRVLELAAGANNRDGLAIRSAGDSLLGRDEENRILIVLSDGRPNDVTVNRPGARNPEPYFGEYAVQDTGYEVRALRSAGIYVLGVFTGGESDLAAEKKIFGKDFCYIRDIRNFSRVVCSYLTRILDRDE